MPPKRAATAAVGKTLQERREAAREAALKELKALRADLATLEAVLSGKRKKGDFSLFDVAHGAFEIFRYAEAVFEADTLLDSLAVELESVKSLEFLEKHGATELVKPAGWHWISPRGEMHFLGKAEEASRAAEKLATLLAGAKGPKRRPKAGLPDAAATPEPADTPGPAAAGEPSEA
ncbi:MAG: hypothetical protein ACP59X_09015 [Solidesulfovibrio sp. DCME]|uniref:hypothetical protein n=1 Tax=Solidesulfovibrio sp. DCME TaxID=3447380 RepID=UPI003D116B3B